MNAQGFEPDQLLLGGPHIKSDSPLVTRWVLFDSLHVGIFGESCSAAVCLGRCKDALLHFTPSRSLQVRPRVVSLS